MVVVSVDNNDMPDALVEPVREVETAEAASYYDNCLLWIHINRVQHKINMTRV